MSTGKPIEEATEHELLDALGKVWKRAETRNLTRSQVTEIRHCCHYASCRLEDIRREVLRPESKPEHVRMMLTQTIAELQALIAYVDGKGGGFSALGDRNAR